jgi:hypothetical protein
MGKRRWMVMGVVWAACLLAATRASGGGYVVVAVGAGGESGAGSVGGEGGWLGERLLLGIGLASVFTGGEWETINSNPLLSYEEKRNNKAECYGSLGWAVARSWRLVGTAGASFGSTTGRTSTNLGTTVEWDPEYDSGRFACSGLLQFERRRLVVGGGYHNRRGGVGRIGFRF